MIRLTSVARPARGEPGAVLGRQRCRPIAPAGERRRDVRVQPARWLCPAAYSSGRPAALDRLLLVERGDQRVPGDARGDRVDPPVDRGGDELDAAGVGDAGACPRAGRACRRAAPRAGWASQSSSAETSRPSCRRQSTVTVPPESPNPRESQVSTLKPAFRSAADADVAGRLALAASGLRSREPPQPWAIEDRRRPLAARSRGGSSRAARSPSNERTTSSRAVAGAANASSMKAARTRGRRIRGQPARRRRAMRRFTVGSAPARRPSGPGADAALQTLTFDHQEREGDARAASASGRSRRGWRRRCSVPVLARQRSCAAVPRMRSTRRARCAGHRERDRIGSASSPASMPASSSTTSRGWCGSGGESPEPSTIVGIGPELRRVGAHDGGAARGRPTGAEVGAERLEQRLGHVVVRRAVHLPHERRDIRGEAHSPSGVTRSPGRPRRAPAGGRPRRPLELALEALGGEARRACAGSAARLPIVRPWLKGSALSGPTHEDTP